MACLAVQRGLDARCVVDILVDELQVPQWIAYQAMERAEADGLIEWGVLLESAHLTERGVAVIEALHFPRH